MNPTLVHDYPYQPSMPACCYFCNASPRTNRDWPTGEPVVATGKWVEMEGHVHLCATCVGEMARLIGWAPPDEVSARTVEMGHLQDGLAAAVAQVEQYRSANVVLASGILEQTFADAGEIGEQDETAPWGYRADGQPREKPGRKVSA